MRKQLINGHLLDILEPGDAGYEDKRWRANGDTPNRLELRVSEKKAISIYGLRRFPVTLYADEMERVLAIADGIREFIASHPELARKLT